MKQKVLNEEQVNKIKSKLNAKQNAYLDEHIEASRASKWLEILAKRKSSEVNSNMTIEEIEDVLENWEIVNIKSADERIYECECKRPLKKQFIVLNKKTKERQGLGSECVKKYMRLDSKLIRDIDNGFHEINLERDEILLKFIEKDFYDSSWMRFIEEDPSAKEILYQQEEIGLPLSEKQRKKLIAINNKNTPGLNPSNYLKELNKRKRPKVYPKVEPKEPEIITYEWLLERYGDILKEISSRQQELSDNGRREFQSLRKFASDLRDGNETEIDYSIFKLRVINFCNRFSIKEDI